MRKDLLLFGLFVILKLLQLVKLLVLCYFAHIDTGLRLRYSALLQLQCFISFQRFGETKVSLTVNRCSIFELYV